MSKKKAATATPKITTVKKGEIFENKHQDLIEVANGRLKDEGDLGMSFEGRTITFNDESKTATKEKTTDRFYLDELVRKLTKAEYDEWVATGIREAEATEGNGETATSAATVAKPKGAKTKAAKPKDKTPAKAGKMSALDAAAKVLGESGEPMTTKAMIETMAAKAYWTSPGGQTPAATLYAAILREINTKGDESRFTKTDRGLFGLNPKSAS